MVIHIAFYIDGALRNFAIRQIVAKMLQKVAYAGSRSAIGTSNTLQSISRAIILSEYHPIIPFSAL